MKRGSGRSECFLNVLDPIQMHCKLDADWFKLPSMAFQSRPIGHFFFPLAVESVAGASYWWAGPQLTPPAADRRSDQQPLVPSVPGNVVQLQLNCGGRAHLPSNGCYLQAPQLLAYLRPRLF